MTEPAPMPLKLAAIVLDCPDPRQLAGFYGRLLGWTIDEGASNQDWVELADPSGGPAMAFQRDPEYVPPTWPAGERPQMVHLDIRVPDLAHGNELAHKVGATSLPQPEDRLDSPFLVYADPAGHPFCLCEG